MHNYPYPPQWFKKSSVDPLTAWDDYRDSLLYWAEDWWDNFFEDELRSVWKMTLYAGSAALILMILLFLETRNSPPAKKLASLEQDIIAEVETSAPAFKEVVKPEVVKKPKKIFDPFEKYAAPPIEETPTVPRVNPFAMPKPVVTSPGPVPTPPLMQSKLVVQSNKTDLLPDFRHSEKPGFSTANSRYVSPSKEDILLTDSWRVSRAGEQFGTSATKHVSWFDTPAAQQVKNTTEIQSDATRADSFAPGSAVVVSKQMPQNVTAGAVVSYELVVNNRSSTVQNNVLLEEVVSDHQSVSSVVPAAQVHHGALRWLIDSLEPGEQRHFKITCVASRNSAVLQTETRLQLRYSLVSNTVVFVPDVVVSLTLPVAVDQAEEFPVQIEIANHSDRIFAESDLKIQLLQGVLANNSKELIRKVKVPAPGKSVTLPIKLTAAEVGTGIIEAELDLEETLMVPVTARTTIRSGKKPTEKNSPDAMVKKVSPQLAEAAEGNSWRSRRATP